MITGENENTVNQIRKYIDNQAMIGDGGVDWEKVSWIETLDRMVNCLKIAPLSYRYSSKEEIEERFFTAECSVCGWWGSSKLLDGGGAIADTGDHFDCVCPVCGSPEIDDKGDEPI